MIFAACNTDNGIDDATYERLDTVYTMDNMLDLMEMRAVRDSWSHAELFNMDEKREHEAAVRAVGGRPAYARKPPRRSR